MAGTAAEGCLLPKSPNQQGFTMGVVTCMMFDALWEVKQGVGGSGYQAEVSSEL